MKMKEKGWMRIYLPFFFLSILFFIWNYLRSVRCATLSTMAMAAARLSTGNIWFYFTIRRCIAIHISLDPWPTHYFLSFFSSSSPSPCASPFPSSDVIGVELSRVKSRVEWSGVLIYYIFFLMSRVKGKRQAAAKYEFKVHIDSEDTVFNCRWIFRM